MTAHPQPGLQAGATLLIASLLLHAAMLGGQAAGRERAGSITDLITPILACDGSTEEGVVAGHLDRLRARGRGVREAGYALVTLLPEQSRLYQGRGPNEVVRLRGYLLATLADVGPPPEALPYVLAELAHGHRVYLMAASARAAGALGSAGRAAIPYLLRILSPSFHDDQVCLTVYNPDSPFGDPTTARLEAVRALGQIGPEAREALPLLRTLATIEPPGHSPVAVALRIEAQHAVWAIDRPDPVTASTAGAAEERAFVSPWLSPRQRAGTPLAGLIFTAQDGRQRGFSDLAGRPLALTFAYTRCDNPNKCPLTIASMARLQRSLRNVGLEEVVRLVVITLDPWFDDEIQLALFGTIHGLHLNDQTLMMRPAAGALQRLERMLDIPVGRGAGQINGHGVELYLFDRHGRYVRRYHSVVWDDYKVLADLKRLSFESR